jgi:hypothetical protein
VPLVTEGLAWNISTLRNSVANVLVDSGYAARKLQGNACDELACMTDVSAATREEKAGPETVPLKEYMGDSTSDRRFPGTSQAAQPENALLSRPSAHSYIPRRTSTRVFSRHVGSCCFAYELKGASAAYGKLLSGLSSPNFQISAQFQSRRGRYAHENYTSLQGEHLRSRQYGHPCRYVQSNFHPSHSRRHRGRASASRMSWISELVVSVDHPARLGR